MAYRHGVYNIEQPTSMPTPQEGRAAIQVIIGTAPIHLAKDPAAAVNKPILCSSYKEAVEAFGYSDDFDNFTLCQSIQASFGIFNVAPIILINVLDPANTAHVTENSAESCAVSDKTAVYKKQYVLLDALSVKNGQTDLVRGTDYSAEHDDDGNVVITLISETASAASSLSISGKSLKPSGVTASDIIGAVDTSTGKETGLETIRQVFPRLGKIPGTLLAPGWSHNAVVAAALQAKTEAINGVFNCVCLIDIPSGSSGATVCTGVKTAKESLGVTSPHAAALWPMAQVGKKKYYMSAIFGAMMAYNDVLNGDVPCNPSNKALPIDATVLADGTEVLLDQQQADDYINAVGVITAINAGGFRSWGNNTAAYPDTADPKDRWFAVRRFFDWDGNEFVYKYTSYIDKPASKRLIQSIVDSQNIIGNGYVARDYCAAYHMEFRADENSVEQLLAGQLTVHTLFAPYIPAETIENIREYDVSALESVIGG